MARYALAMLAGCILSGQVRLEHYPQKVVTQYPAGSPDVAAAARTGAVTQLRSRDGALWRKAARGLTREDPKARRPLDRLQYFHSRRYLPDDEVEHIAAGAGGDVWVRTRTGFSWIQLRPMSLSRKAGLFEARIRDRHDRYGMVADSRLARPGDLASSQLDTNDNDGLWTALYAAAECFRYQVTRSAEALDRARRATEAVLFLETISGRPGYPARSYIRKGDRRAQGGVWHWTPDGEVEWKSDTSSDEIVGHFYLFGIAYDLLPDAGLRTRIAGAAGRVMDHILDHGLNLTDIHGNPTFWGRWSEEYFGTARGKPDSPLNALEILAFLRTAHHITGVARYEAEYRRLATERGYLRIASSLTELRRTINYSDEELAMLPFYLLFRYEKDPAMLASYRAALDQWWQNIRRENNPLWNFIYYSANPRLAKTPAGREDLLAGVHTLYRIPLDLISWRIENSWRSDIEWAGQPDRFGRREARTFLPPDERPVMKWNGNPFIVDGGNGGYSEDDGAFFLLPYWMGRSHGFLSGE